MKPLPPISSTLLTIMLHSCVDATLRRQGVRGGKATLASVLIPVLP